MIKNAELSFTRFYIAEFLQEVINKIPDNVSAEHAGSAKELIQHLTRQEDVTDGIELIAREQGSGELSIFLFDIVDRIEDYPPTVAYDALPDIVDDFVSGFDLMMEEKETVDAITKVNEQFKSRSGEITEEPEIEPEVVETESIEPEPEPEEVQPSLPEDIAMLQEQAEQAEETGINFEQFFEQELMDSISGSIEKQLSGDIMPAAKSFGEILFENISTEFDSKISQPLVDAVSVLRSAFPWRAGHPYRASDLMANQSKFAEQYVASIVTLSQENPDIIADSVVQARIVLPEIKEVKPEEEVPAKPAAPQPEQKFAREEVSEEPTTIDAILSEYFQSEVDEHLATIADLSKQLESDPANSKIIKDLIAALQSFNEISMIHGYVPIESFCGRMIEVFTEGLNNKMQVDPRQIASFPEALNTLRRTDQLKDPKQKTEAAQKLADMTEIIETAMFIKREKKKKAPAKKKAQETESQPQVKTDEKDIGSDDKAALAGIFKDILMSVKTDILKDLASDDPGDDNRRILEGLHTAAQSTGLTGLGESIGLFADALMKKPNVSSDELQVIFSEFVESINHLTEPETWRDRLAPAKVETESIAFENTQELLKIISDTEQANLKSFPGILDAVFEQGDKEIAAQQQIQFNRLSTNLRLIGAKDRIALADYFATIFSDVDQLPKLTAEQAQEIVQSYKIFLQSLQSKEAAVNPSDLVDILKEMLTTEEESAESVAESESVESSIEKPEQEPVAGEELLTDQEQAEEPAEAEDEDEDLAEIFKQEAESAFTDIKSAVTELEKDAGNKDAYLKIERNVHSLKSSARLMGMNEVSNVAAPLEDFCERLASGGYNAGDAERDVVIKAVSVLSETIEGKQEDGQSVIDMLNDFELTELSEDNETASTSAVEAEEKEKPVFSADADEDDDLLQIFKEESAEFVKLLREAVDELNKNPNDQDAAKKLEHASHSLKSPAKMLGFSDIGQMGDAIELVAEAALKGELTLNKAAVAKVADSIGVIDQLSEGTKLAPDRLTDMLSQLEVSNLGRFADAEPEPETEEQVDLSTFFTESEELLAKINNDLLALEKNPADTKLIDSTSRYLHTLKGGAQLMGLEKIGNLAHAIEDIFSYLKENDRQITERTTDLVFRSVDGIQTFIHDVKTGKADSENIYKQLMNALQDEVQQLQKDQTPAIRTVEMDNVPEMQKDAEKTIKITTDRLDNFVNMAAELVINKTQLAEQLEKLRDIRLKIEDDRENLKKTGGKIESILGKKTGDEASESPEDLLSNFTDILSNLDDLSHRVSIITQNFDQNINQISHLSKTLHDNMLQVRMVPTEELFNRYPRAVRDMAKKQKKKINLLVEGEDTEMDRVMIESLTDPVMHLVRNAVDHGIELPKTRKETDKNEDGIILLKARRDKNQVVIEVQDDGKGIDLGEIKKSIVRKKLAKKAEVDKLSDEDILDYIFHPGFTTKRSASRVSGRGVGLDVVMEEIQKLKGDIRVSSNPGKGTIFSIRLPLTVAITQALLVRVKGESLAIPINAIEETLDYDTKSIITKDKKDFLKVRRAEIPLVKLTDFVKYDSGQKGEEKSENVIIVKDGKVRYGLVVDRALRREEIVVRSLGQELADMDNVAGGTIFGDGTVVLIVDIPAITRKIEADFFGEERDFSSLESARNLLDGKIQKPKTAKKPAAAAKKSGKRVQRKKVEERKPNALIIDDSLSVRKFVSSVLERNNYTTVLAEDGPEALEELKTTEFDIIITDLEMPKMQGFELIEKVRAQDKLKDVPIVILTGKAAKENKEKGLNLGANAYIVKPFKENDLLKTLEEFIQI